MPHLVSTLGPIGSERTGIILPHEHVFVDLRTPETPGHAQAETANVVQAMTPLLAEAREAGIGVIAEASCVGVGRRADILRAVSEAASMPLLAPTGIYREPWVPRWAHGESEDGLCGWMVAELKVGIECSGVRAGWIKLSAGDDGLSVRESTIFRAAVRASRETGAALGSHTIRGSVVLEQLRILDSLGLDPGRFIWIHAQAEEDFSLNLAVARRGAWIEYDDIGSPQSDARALQRVLRMLDADLGNRILLSQDRGWFDPSQPHGGEKKSYAGLVTEFIPKLRTAGVGEIMVATLTRENPFQAFARD
jgi:phosphotriesterase-related protein